MKDTVCPLLIPKKKSLEELLKLPPKSLNTKELNEVIGYYENQADRFSRSDWDEYLRTTETISNLNMIQLDKFNQENETFLQNHGA